MNGQTLNKELKENDTIDVSTKDSGSAIMFDFFKVNCFFEENGKRFAVIFIRMGKK